MHCVLGGQLDGHDRFQCILRGLCGWEVRCNYRRFRVLGLRGGKLFGRWRKCLHVVRRRHLLGGFRDFQLFELRTRGELACGIERLHGLLGGHFPGLNWRLKLRELRLWDNLGIGRECMFKLHSGHLSKLHGCFKLHSVSCWNGVKHDRRVCVEHLRVLFGGLILFDCGCFFMYTLRCWELCVS